MREHQRAAELLVGMAHVEPEVEVHLDGLVELALRPGLQHPDGLRGAVDLLAVDLRARVAVVLAVLAHEATSTPIDRAVPAMISAAASTSRAFRSGIFASAIWRTCSRVSRPTFSRFGSPEPFSIRSASLIRTAAGGVFVMKSNEVLVDRDLDRDDPAVLLLGLGVERLAELHDVDAVLAERRADRRRGVRLPARDLQLDECQNLLGHFSPVGDDG